MPLPDFDSGGDLPEGVYQASIDEICARFGQDTPQRQVVTARLLRIYHLAEMTGKLDRVIIFGSYITAKPDPNDVDVVLVMRDDFELQACDDTTRRLFDHTEATEEFGASIFWLRPSMLFLQ
ncbi:DUF6932 family protein [Candidatus Entotheonella palauensis]|uniref:DUF6932 family protein n=1 Tax=Candidatus Entotheonella palauensis TaxID=93172 RepID=UPI000B7CE410|nr:hypothetical protein [Candidatus Entotheonella palauensis]